MSQVPSSDNTYLLQLCLIYIKLSAAFGRGLALAPSRKRGRRAASQPLRGRVPDPLMVRITTRSAMRKIIKFDRNN